MKDLIIPPGSLGVSFGDFLEVAVLTLDDISLNVCGTYLTEDGKLGVFREIYILTASTSYYSRYIPLPNGYLTSVYVYETTKEEAGKTHVICRIVDSQLATRTFKTVVIQGYVYNGGQLQHPNNIPEKMIVHPGGFYRVVGSAPAAGANANIAVPTRARWKVLSGLFTFTTDATVATRTVRLRWVDATDYSFRTAAPSDQAASLVYQYNFGPGLTAQAVAGLNVAMSMPNEVWIPEGGKLETDILNLQAGDQVAAMTLFVLQSIEM